MKFLSKFLASYDYPSLKDFLLSLFPTWKYQIQTTAFILSGLAAGVNHLIGIGPALALAMVGGVIAEIASGIKASKSRGDAFESFRFSRCILKIVFWFALFYFVHAFEKEYLYRDHFMDVMAFLFFKSLFVGLMALFCIEYLTSILENLSVIDGKDKTYYINFIKSSFTNLLDNLKRKQQ